MTLALALGLLSKPMLVTLPFALLLLDYWPLGRLRGDDPRGLPDPRRLGRLALEKVPLLLMVAIVSVVTFVVQDADGAMFTIDQLSASARLNNALESYAIYIAQSVWPSGLAASYPHALEAFSPWRGAAAGLLIGLVTAAVVAGARRRPYLPVGWFWYLGTLVPVIGIVQVGMQAHADRYMYIPLIGLALIAAWGAHDLLAHRRAGRALLGGAAGAAIALLAAAAWVQVGYWRDTIVVHSRIVTILLSLPFCHPKANAIQQFAS